MLWKAIFLSCQFQFFRLKIDCGHGQYIMMILRLRRLCSSLSKIDPEKPTWQLAMAASRVIKFPAAQPYLAGSNHPEMPMEKDQKDSLVLCVLRMLEKERTPLNVLEFFRQMFDPKRGVVLPAAHSGQQRIKIGYSSNQWDYSYSFLPNRVVTPLVFKVLTTYDSKHLLYGEGGIAKTCYIVFYCYLARLITLFDFSKSRFNQFKVQDLPDHEFFKSYFGDINRVIYLSYFEQNSSRHKLLSQIFNQQLPKNIRLNNYQQYQYKIAQLFKKKGIRGRVVLDQFNSLAQLADKFNLSAKTNKKQKQLEK